MHLFPEIGLQENKFKLGILASLYRVFFYSLLGKKEHFRDVRNRRQVLLNYASQNNFDPLVPHNWYGITREKLLSFTVREFCIYATFNRLCRKCEQC